MVGSCSMVSCFICSFSLLYMVLQKEFWSWARNHKWYNKVVALGSNLKWSTLHSLVALCWVLATLQIYNIILDQFIQLCKCVYIHCTCTHMCTLQGKRLSTLRLLFERICIFCLIFLCHVNWAHNSKPTLLSRRLLLQRFFSCYTAVVEEPFLANTSASHCTSFWLAVFLLLCFICSALSISQSLKLRYTGSA